MLIDGSTVSHEKLHQCISSHRGNGISSPKQRNINFGVCLQNKMAYKMETEDNHTSYSPGNDVDGKKRLRCSNFSSQEKNILIHIIEKYQDVIECKKTDKVSVQEREKVWEGIAQEFNEIVLAEPVRTSRQLKMCYENLKRRIRKEVFAEEQKPVKSNIDPVVALRSQVHVPSDVDSNSSTLLHIPQGKTPFIKRKELRYSLRDHVGSPVALFLFEKLPSFIYHPFATCVTLGQVEA